MPSITCYPVVYCNKEREREGDGEGEGEREREGGDMLSDSEV